MEAGKNIRSVMANKNISLEELVEFVNLLNDFNGVERVTRIGSLDRYENDVEHSYSLAMMAWYIIEANKLDLDLGKTMRYALVHDLVEVYAGDTFVYGKKEDLESKEKRELQAIKKIGEKFPKFKALHRDIKAFEARKNSEAKFVYALDKLHPMIQNYLDGGKLWKKFSISLDKIIKEKKKKIVGSAEIERYFKELVKVLKEDKNLFKY